jgi:hypothetical protein
MASASSTQACRVRSRTEYSWPWTFSLVDSDRSSSTRIEKSRVFLTERIMMRGSGWLPRRMSVKLWMAALMSISSPSSSLRMRCTPCGCMASSRNFMRWISRLYCGGDVVDELQVALLGALFQHGGPGRTLQLDLIIPFRIMERVGEGFLAFQFVETLAVALVADVFVGEQFGAEHPDFLGIVAGGFDVDLVGHFHDADVLAHLLDGLVAGAGRLVEIEFLEFPEIAVVVAVRRGEQIGARVEGDPLVAQAMCKLHADFPGGVVAVEPILRVGEQHARLGDPRVVVQIGFVEQRTGEAIEVVA